MQRVSRNKPAKVLIVDDQALYREGLREIMAHWDEFEVIGEAADGWSAVTFCRKTAPDLVIMDNKMPMMDGIEAASKIIRESEGVIVVMLSVSVDEDELLAAFEGGVRGYVLKEAPSRQLRAHLKDALHGEYVVSGSVARWLAATVTSSLSKSVRAIQDNRAYVLESEEREVMALVAEGLSNEEIGAKLYISPGSVKKRLRAVMDKLELRNRVQVAVYAVRNGIMMP